MTAVAVEIVPIRPQSEPDEEIILIEDVDAFAAASTPGCGDDNPYN
ncbi:MULTISPECIES: hypothetical protein [Streptomyces]|uniref:Uncharacterized protein n=1 Tax=Streptomyces celluloflavus TaxID=58344 RepID=A0ABW7R6R4_9ACTN|nr:MULTISPECIES: hypothetical protein [Streptomyces]WSK15014.1 hypothetical protein OG717_26680 [Streptomyces celluloflavus]